MNTEQHVRRTFEAVYFRSSGVGGELVYYMPYVRVQTAKAPPAQALLKALSRGAGKVKRT